MGVLMVNFVTLKFSKLFGVNFTLLRTHLDITQNCLELSLIDTSCEPPVDIRIGLPILLIKVVLIQMQ